MITVIDSNPQRRSLLEPLVAELALYAGVREPSFPIEVRVVPVDSVVTQVHQLTGSLFYQPGKARQTAVVVPLLDGAQRRSVVLLDASEFEDVGEGRTHPVSLVSGLFEELLHARIYC